MAQNRSKLPKMASIVQLIVMLRRLNAIRRVPDIQVLEDYVSRGYE